eukprot:CAMPEP_0116123180 /NCGR_PEP_ID=MMETSP0329-20121206/4610_1 /TAXON_ID=697910 /ORGANISM="Pseudo-nitzschia arenysensis, Strain B593" /LENGTH=518 /DNA_ID=CAMNT_0003617077 /DNA_START=38 /DNA_END=1594 /DNA_ORIENTATION=-
MDVVAVNNGDVVIVNQPSVKELANDESFCTESSSLTNEGEGAEPEAENFIHDGPLAGFRRRRAERAAAREEEQRQAQEKQKQITQAIPERLLEQESASLRANRISVTVVKDESNSYGVGLAQVPRTKNLVRIDALVIEGLLCDSPIRRGDILKSVDNDPVEDYRSVMLQLMDKNGPVTISVDTPASQSNPAMVQAFCRKPSPYTLLGIEFEVVEHSTTQNALCADPNGTQEIATSKLLQIKDIDQAGFFANSVLSPGDFVLSINGAPCTEMGSDQASTMIMESESIVDILALNPKLAQQYCSASPVQRWLRRARRTGVGALGGTMVGLGLVMIPLPFPPPFGEILVVGGVSVLGTEFEAPKRVMRNARDALHNAVESNGDEEVAVDRLQQMESVAGQDETNKIIVDPDGNAESVEDDGEKPVILRDSFLTVMSQQQQNRSTNESLSDCWSTPNIDANIDNMYSGKEHNDSSPPSTSTAKQFLQNVGRNIVLPLLDHAVGDKKANATPENSEIQTPDKE